MLVFESEAVQGQVQTGKGLKRLHWMRNTSEYLHSKIDESKTEVNKLIQLRLGYFERLET